MELLPQSIFELKFISGLQGSCNIIVPSLAIETFSSSYSILSL